MTDKNKQMYDDFQLVYNNLASNLAPGLDLYEISVYLTKAYFSLVDTAYQEYEKSELYRRFLADLVKTKSIYKSLSGIEPIVPQTVFFELPDDVLYIVYESLQMSKDAAKCIRYKRIKVTPVKYDDLHSIYENPFRFNLNKALRLDISNNKNYVEIITKDQHVDYYYIRYIKKPSPIILETLTGNDKIEGIQEETECELDTKWYQNIVQLAASMAYQHYKNI
jgi:hypothetical protein